MGFNQGMDSTEKRNFWLMKSEPNCFSLDDLKNRPDGIEPWDGVRNYQARNLLRDSIKCGDGVLFYHSNISKPAIVGLAQVVREGYPDYTALDPESRHFDPRATEKAHLVHGRCPVPGFTGDSHNAPGFSSTSCAYSYGSPEKGQPSVCSAGYP